MTFKWRFRVAGIPNLGQALDRVMATAQNGLEVIRMGGLETGTQPSPYQIVESERMYQLRRYFPDSVPDGPPVVLVHPMMMSANLFDVTPSNGAVSILHDAGLDPWVVDFGSPDKIEGGMDRTLTDHIVAVSEIIDRVREITGRDVHLAGYSQGGMFAYQTAAFRRSAGIASLITFGSPVDVLNALPMGLPANLAAPGAQFLADNVFSRIAIPGWMARTGFQMLDPIKTARSRIDFVRQLHDREALLPREDQRRFLENDGWVAWSGPAIAELLRQFVAHNRMMSGGFVINDQLVTLAEITCPVLAFVGSADDIGQPTAVRGIQRAAPRAQIYEALVPTGHFGMVVGGTATRETWPTTAEWIKWRDGAGDMPGLIAPMDDSAASGASVSSRLTLGLSTVIDVGAGASRDILGAADSVRRTSQAVVRESVRTLPRLVRLGQIQSGTRISLGKLMNENAERNGRQELFLFEDRVLSHREVNERIDNVVRGLIACGVRPGSHIGVIMETRPSALVAIAALSRLGAVAVMLAPDTDLPTALRLGDCTTVIADPVNLDRAAGPADRVLVLGGGDARTIAQADGERIIDMEQIDPDEVELPTWYRPDPGLAGDLAFILLARAGTTLEKWPVTNHRWALSAFGSATAAALTSNDTVYCLTPLHHASGLLTTLGATVVGGARIALSSEVEPKRFADEVYRYGITVVSYTWSMLQEVVRDKDLGIGEHNPIRLFLGSGMPVGLWDDVVDRFPSARVLDFFATSDGSAILADVSGKKIGSAGRPLPETNKVRLAAYDPIEDRFMTDRRGFVAEAETDSVGLLLSSARQRQEVGATVLRDVFTRGDRWVTTDRLFRRDSDGDYWLMGTVHNVVRSADGALYPKPILDVLTRMEQVEQAVVLGFGEPGEQIAVASVATRAGATVPTVAQLRLALAGLPVSQRPHIIQIVDEIPMTSAHRASMTKLREQGIPWGGSRVWYRDADGKLRKLTRSAAVAQGWVETPGDENGAG